MLPTPPDLVIGTTPGAHFGAGSIARLPELISAAGGKSALVVTDGALAATGVIAANDGRHRGRDQRVRSGDRRGQPP